MNEEMKGGPASPPPGHGRGRLGLGDGGRSGAGGRQAVEAKHLETGVWGGGHVPGPIRSSVTPGQGTPELHTRMGAAYFTAISPARTFPGPPDSAQ